VVLSAVPLWNGSFVLIVPFYHFIEKLQEGDTMKTAEEIIAYLESALSEAIELHDESTDPAQRLSLMLKAYTISELLDEIKQ
jgi:hypothetical protein